MKSIMQWILLLVLMLYCASTINAQELGKFFRNTEGAFVLYDLKNDRYIRYNEPRCRQRFCPYSTFKIPNSVIGLDTGVIKDAEFIIPWDSKRYPVRERDVAPFKYWAQDQTLRSAIKYSCVWYYQELAQRVGNAKMQKYVEGFHYGNQDISGGIDKFWLNSSLQISADEQIEFLKALYAGRLPVSPRSMEIVKDILLLEQTASYKLSAKTGSGP
ncbi:MAG: penicillin-binding transpeptidase domain-containing protein, partial [Acidobacteriota bacterium]